MKVKDIIKRLQQYKNQDCELVFDMFDEDDIRNKAEDLGMDMSDKEVSDVIKYLEHHADAEQGMSWNTIEYVIGQIKDKG